jgi:hypothetical protein
VTQSLTLAALRVFSTVIRGTKAYSARRIQTAALGFTFAGRQKLGSWLHLVDEANSKAIEPQTSVRILRGKTIDRRAANLSIGFQHDACFAHASA